MLRADLFRPDTPEKLPVLLNRTPYDKSLPMVFALHARRASRRRGRLQCARQDCRGRFASDGVFNCFTDEARDGYDTIEWAARQPWADGKVGMYGASYMGATQWLAATQAPPSLKAMVAVDHRERLSRRLDLSGRRVLAVLQRELDDGARSRRRG